MSISIKNILGILLISSNFALDPAWAQAAKVAAKSAAKGVLATINGKVITVEEFNKRFEQNSKLVPGTTPSKADVLKNIVYFELATQEARRLNLHRDPDLLDQFNILLYQSIIRRNVQPKVDALKVAVSALQKYYAKNPLLRTSHIILLSKPGMTEAQVKDLKTRANAVLTQVRAGKKSFEDLARQYSEGPSAKTGGDVDWGARHKLLPEYYDAALKLKKVGDVSGLVETPYGIHIIKLTGRKPFEEMDPVYREFVVRNLREQEGQEIFTAYFEDLKKKGSVTINEALL